MNEVTIAFSKFLVYALMFGLVLFCIIEWIKSIKQDKDDYYGK